jgi:hypothetical protein
MESVTSSTHDPADRNGSADRNGNGNADRHGNGGQDDVLELGDLWRVWVTPSDRKRCTYVTRDEQALAAAGLANRS